MNHDDITPERLDAILDGAEATSDDEGAFLALAADLRASSPKASDALRDHVTALGEPARQPKLRRRASRWMVAAPALGAVAVLTIGGFALTRSDSGSNGTPSAGERLNKTEKASSPSGALPTSPQGSEDVRGLNDNTERPKVDPSSTAIPDATTGILYEWQVPREQLAATLSDIHEIGAASQANVDVVADGTAQLVSVALPAAVRDDLVDDLAQALNAHAANLAGKAMAARSDQRLLRLRLVPKRWV